MSVFLFFISLFYFSFIYSISLFHFHFLFSFSFSLFPLPQAKMTIEGEKLLKEVGTSTKKRSATDSDILVLDNGSCVFRCGFSSDQSPALCFASAVHKGQPRGASSATSMEVVFGGEEGDLAQYTRVTSKTAFDQNIVVNFDVLEMQLDHSIQLLHSSPPLPIVMTESLGSFESTRAATNELLFDGYGCSRIAYGIDSLFSYFATNNEPFGLVVCLGNKCTHVIPIVNGKAELGNAKRLGVGGFQMQEFMLKLLQLKYPNFPYKLTFGEASLFTYSHCKFAQDYSKEIHDCLLENANSTCIQFPVPSSPSPSLSQENKKTVVVGEEEKQKQDAQKKEEFAQKMKQQAVEKRKERLDKYETELSEFVKLYYMEKTDPVAFKSTLEYLEFDDKQDLLNAIVKTRESVNAMRQKMDLDSLPFDEEFDKTKETVYNWDLLNVSDDELDEDEVKEKRKLRLVKASMEARERLKKEKEVQLQREKEEAELKEQDFSKWLSIMHSKRNLLLSQLNIKVATKETKVDRMRKMASMVDTDEEPKPPSGKGTPKKAKKSKKTKGTGVSEQQENDDSFGIQDADWAVYQDIQVNQQLDENLQEELERIEEILLTNDPNYSPAIEKETFSVENSSLFCKFLYGKMPGEVEVDDNYRIYLNAERVKVPEILFHPSMIGIDQCGLAELIIQVIMAQPEQTARRLAGNIFVCGSPCRIPGLRNRLYADVRSCIPEEWDLTVSVDSDPLLAWKGASKWAQEHHNSDEKDWITDKSDSSLKYCLYN